jgi:hypothetical protein
MLIGPWGLGVVADAESTLQFAEFGVVLLLFLIGLELDPVRLWTLRRTVFGLGGAQVGVTGAIFALVAMALGPRMAGGARRRTGLRDVVDRARDLVAGRTRPAPDASRPGSVRGASVPGSRGDSAACAAAAARGCDRAGRAWLDPRSEGNRRDRRGHRGQSFGGPACAEAPCRP